MGAAAARCGAGRGGARCDEANVSYLDKTARRSHVAAMLNLISLLFGLMAFPVMLVALVPLLGWLNYAVLPLAIVGLAFGTLSSGNAGRNLNMLVLVIGCARLWMGGFIF